MVAIQRQAEQDQFSRNNHSPSQAFGLVDSNTARLELKRERRELATKLSKKDRVI